MNIQKMDKNPDEYLEDEYQNPIISIKQYLYIVFFLFFEIIVLQRHL